MSNYFEIPVGEPQQTESRADESRECDSCHNQAEFIADNNEAEIAYAYCGVCEEKRAEKFGCAMILSEGAQCEDGICGCGGTGVL
jgi:hypothetical protein